MCLITLSLVPCDPSSNFRGCSAVKNPQAVQELQEIQLQCPGREDALEDGIAIRSSILASRIPRIEEPSGLQFLGSQRVGHD